MSVRFAKFAILFCCAALIFPMVAAGQANTGAGGGVNNGVAVVNLVGGVKIDPNGVLSGANELIDKDTQLRLESNLGGIDGDIQEQVKLRFVSLRALETIITDAKNEGTPIPHEATLMAGLQRVEYIILDTENNDVVLAGPAEGFKVTANGVVGNKSNTPVIQLEDFLVAMRSTDNARSGKGISVSIDPTEQGIKQLQSLFGQLKRARTPFNPDMQPAVEKAMGEQVINLTGVPTNSRFSQVLVAADYKMKRLSMGLEPAKIKNFPSFMEIAQKSNVKNMTAAPRFWMECNYQPLAKSEDGHIWQIRGQGVKTLTEETKFDRSGKKSQTGAQNRFAKKWADAMTERFDELAQAEPAFRELRNMMDLSVAAAIIRREGLAEKVGLEIPAILGLTNAAVVQERSVPKTVPAECSFVRIAKSWLVSASGGVQLDPWGVASKFETADLSEVAKLARNATPSKLWWNAAN